MLGAGRANITYILEKFLRISAEIYLYSSNINTFMS